MPLVERHGVEDGATEGATKTNVNNPPAIFVGVGASVSNAEGI
jgi:hypothetical protein